MKRSPPLMGPRLNLALQGGGAHGAFTWGVLDTLLEDPAIEFGWLSGTSAGAVNALALASGLATGGREGARATLSRVWNAIVQASVPDAIKLNPLLAAQWESFSRSGTFDHMRALFSPYDLNPFGIDPLRRIFEAELDFPRLRATSGPELLIAATDIQTGRARLFRRAEISVEALLASACLPTVHKSVAIGTRNYWDGGFSANPDLMTLAAESPTADTLIVQLVSLVRDALPTSARDIAAHVSHLTFQRPYIDSLDRIVALQGRARGLGKVATMVNPRGRDACIARHRFHLIDAGRFTARLPAGSEGRPDDVMIGRLFQDGRQEAGKWLDRHRADIGRRDTAELAKRLAAGSSAAEPEAAVDSELPGGLT